MTRERRAILVAAVDESERAATVVQTAAGLASTLPGAELHLVHVVDAVDPPPVTLGGSPLSQPALAVLLEEGRAYLKRWMDDAKARCGGARVVGHIAAGPVWREVLQVAVDLDAAMLVIGAKPQGALRRLLLGSVAETIVERSPLPVLVAREKGPVPAELSPPCPACLGVQRASGGERLWCDEHEKNHPRAHVFTEMG